MHLRFALMGNQNSGKTTLFNQLTGSNQHVGNWPGVTVEQKIGVLTHHHHGGDAHIGLPFLRRWRRDSMTDIEIVDLPGIYSLSPFTMEEVVSRNYVTLEKPELILNIVDATNLERNLYLTLQLAELGVPMVVALNMMDEVTRAGDIIHVDALERELGVPVVSVCARRGDGLDELVRRAVETAEKKVMPRRLDICSGEAHEALHAVMHLMEDTARAHGLSPRYAATKLMEGDEPMETLLELPEETKHIISEILARMEARTGMERAAVMADMRYTFIEKITAQCVRRAHDALAPTRSQRMDRVLTNKFLAIPVFILAMLAVFAITFGPPGTLLADGFSALVGRGVDAVDGALRSSGAAEWVRALIVDGVLTGVGSVLSFMPTILLLFLCLSFLEDSGYMARAAFLMDKPLRKLGLNGRSFIPMIMGFGCTVPAVMGARVMSSRRDRRLTIMLTPFMSCGAKVPIYALFTQAFFPGQGILVMSALYLGGVLVAIACGLALKRTLFHGDAAPFIMELPAYRLPTPVSVLRVMRDKAVDFIRRAFTVIFAATVVVWFLQSFTFSMDATADVSMSILGGIAAFIAPVFAPLGFGSAAPVTAVITGVMAKESVVSTLAVLSHVDAQSAEMLTSLHGIFPDLAAVCAFLTFILLYMPCVAAYAAMRREMESKPMALATVAMQTGVAWVTALCVHAVVTLFI